MVACARECDIRKVTAVVVVVVVVVFPIGPLLFALPLEKPGSEWQYALVLEQKLTLKRTAMPVHWDWPLAPPLTVTAAARKIVWEDVWSLPANASALLWQDQVTDDSNVDVELVPYGCSKMY